MTTARIDAIGLVAANLGGGIPSSAGSARAHTWSRSTDLSAALVPES